MAGERILVVEDNAMNMELALALLEKADCVALQATSAEAGIQLARMEQPRLILMDVSLPGMDGLTAVSILKQDPTTKDIPIIVLTANAMRGDQIKASEAGSDGYLTKPINVREFLEVIGRYTGSGEG